MLSFVIVSLFIDVFGISGFISCVIYVLSSCCSFPSVLRYLCISLFRYVCLSVVPSFCRYLFRFSFVRYFFLSKVDVLVCFVLAFVRYLVL